MRIAGARDEGPAAESMFRNAGFGSFTSRGFRAKKKSPRLIE